MSHDAAEPTDVRQPRLDRDRSPAADAEATIAALRAELVRARRESRHHIRNILAVTRSIARRTADDSDTVEEYQAQLEGRLGAFGRAQAALIADPTAGVELAALIADELLAFGVQPGARVALSGDPLRMSAKPAGLLGLALHELATHAVRRNAFDDPAARLDIAWTCEAETDAVRIDWLLSGGRAHPSPARPLAVEAVAGPITYELGGEAELDETADGLVCRIRLPGGRRTD